MASVVPPPGPQTPPATLPDPEFPGDAAGGRRRSGHPPGPGHPGGGSPAGDSPQQQGALTVEIPLGRRVMVVGDLLLPDLPTPSSQALANDVALTLERWEGPGVVVVCGNLFGIGPGGGLNDERAERILSAHPRLHQALAAFTGRPDCRILLLPGWRDRAVAEDPVLTGRLGALGLEVAGSVDLRLVTAAGTRHVLVEPGHPSLSVSTMVETTSTEGRPWLEGLSRLEDPALAGRFVTSRTLYRRLGRFLWVPPLLAVVVALVIRVTAVFHGVDHLVRRAAGPRRVLRHAYGATWTSRLFFTLAVIVVLELLLGAVVAVASRRFWRAQGGGTLPAPWSPSAQGPLAPSSGLRVGSHQALDQARTLVGSGVAGLVTGGGLRAELTHLDPGFYASPGGTTELVREHPGRAGLPPVFLHHRQASWVELETGADLHVRLLLADVELPSSTMLERLATPDQVVKGYKPTADLHPAMVASWPRGASWPPAPDVAADRVRVRRIRRLAAAAIFVAGLVDLLIAVTPPLRGHRHLVEEFLPLGLAQAAGALVALAGIGLMMLARGVLRGQRRAWLVSVVVLTVTVVAHLVHGANFGGVALSVLVLVLLVVQRDRFSASADSGSLRSAVLTLVVGATVAIVAATVAIEVGGAVHHHQLPHWPVVLGASAERLIGLRTVSLPDTADDWASPSLLAVGIGLALVALYLLTRPVVDRRLSSSRASSGRRAAEARARDIVRRHGTGTLDYFALRDDKHFFFHRDSLVAYAVYGGVCLVSPDPIGPHSERGHVWDAFRRFADRNGWAVGVMAAAEEWLPNYRDTGMRYLYIGDEAVVDVQAFSLAGGKMKGLRQAVRRVERHGYRVEFLDPAHVDPIMGRPLANLMERHRRGEAERGFSMMLGRMFDPRDTGLLLTVVYGPDDEPAAMCQFVPSQAINGYSLDLMRRDPGEHPNGLLDYALCSTIDHLRQQGGAASASTSPPCAPPSRARPATG